jgi:hypothetical protein
MSAADKRAVAEGLAHYERQLAERTGPAPTWKDFLPDALAARAAELGDADPAATLRAAAGGAAPRAGAVGRLTADQIALLDATVRTAPPVAAAAPTPEELFPAVKPPRKRAKREAAPAPAPAAPVSAVSGRARAALAAVWDLTFDGGANPFRTRLTRAACASLGVADYHDVVADVVDLALIQKRASSTGGYYADDAALRNDVRAIAANAAAYHGADSALAAQAADLAAAYDAAYATAR